MSRRPKKKLLPESRNILRPEKTIHGAGDQGNRLEGISPGNDSLSAMKPGKHNRLILPAVCVFLLLAVVLVYGQTIRHDFLNYDDNEYVTDNATIKDGVSWSAICWSFTSYESANWHPITWLSHMLDCQIFGLNPGWHHAVNVAFHIVNSILLYILLFLMTGAPWCSAMVAALFALHPLHVESVAWISERKDVLSTMFMMLTILAYLHYVFRPSVVRYVPVFILLALGLMCKPMLVTLPFVLLLLDYWPLGRWINSPSVYWLSTSDNTSYKTARWLVVEKIPLLVLSLASSIVTCIAQKEAMAMPTALSLPTRLDNALLSYVEYLLKTIWPYQLIVIYPYVPDWPWWQPAAAAVILIIVTVLVIWLWQRLPYLAVGWFWYLGTLAPAIGLIQVGAQSMADRYTYIPLIGIFILGVWGVADLAASRRYRRSILGILAAATILACMILTAEQVRHWANGRTLFEYALSVTPDNQLAHNNLGIELAKTGRDEEAIEHYKQALRLNPDLYEAHYNLGNALLKTKKPREAILEFQEAIRLKQNYPEARYNMAVSLMAIGQTEEAIKNYKQALLLKPDYAEAHNNLGNALYETGQMQDAIAEYRQSILYYPANYSAHYNLALALSNMGQNQEAIDEYLHVIRLKPDYIEAYYNLANALAQTERTQESIKYYEMVLQLKPDYFEAQINLGVILVRIDRVQDGIDRYKEALRIKPDSVMAYFNLALAYAKLNQSSEVIANSQKALELARMQKQDALAKQIENWLNAYRAAGQNIHDASPSSKVANPPP